jgi:hypothetical protein
MTFEQDVLAMTAEQVHACIEGRLRDGVGPAWNESQGEPVWAWLVSAFHYWRRQPSQLRAIDQCLTHLVPNLFAECKWPAAEATCDYLLALNGLQEPWQPQGAEKWPFRQWIQLPDRKIGAEQATAMAAALRLMRRLGLVQTTEALRNFRQIAAKVGGNSEDRQAALYLLECWKAWADARSGQSKALESSIWFELLRYTHRWNLQTLRQSIETLAMDWALGRCSATEVGDFKNQLFLAIQQLNETEARANALFAAKEVIGELPVIDSMLQRAQAQPSNSQDLRDTTSPDRRSNLWLQPALRPA